MALLRRLDLRQSQSIIMTPKLQEAIKLLQLSNVELSEYLEVELEKNPFLFRLDVGDPAETDKNSTDNFCAANKSKTKASDIPMTEANKHLIYDNILDKRNLFQTPTSETFPIGVSTAKFISTAQENVSLQKHLLLQINVDIPDRIDRVIAIYMLDSLDGSGYLTADINAIAETLGCSIYRVKRILNTVQHFDPPGIFARNLSECLALQIKDRDRYDSAMQKLINNLDLLAKRKFDLLKGLCGVDDEDLREMIKEIRGLQPKPAVDFDQNFVPVVTPDVFVYREKRGRWLVELNTDTLPKVMVNNRYYKEINEKSLKAKDKTYLSDSYRSANWLLRSIDQRANTIVNVVSEITRQQAEFLEKGVKYLKPLVLKDIADVLNIHESTVSRVTRNKIVATPRGIFDLKYFFSFSIGHNRNSDIQSSEAIRFQIKNLIEAETPDNILSDDKIVNILKNDGIEIARRTVAKYREVMHISSSIQRKRDKIISSEI